MDIAANTAVRGGRLAEKHGITQCVMSGDVRMNSVSAHFQPAFQRRNALYENPWILQQTQQFEAEGWLKNGVYWCK